MGRDREMPITCRRTVIHADIAAYACKHACTRTNAHTQTDAQKQTDMHTQDTPSRSHSWGFYYGSEKVTHDPFVLLLQWINRNIDAITCTRI